MPLPGFISHTGKSFYDSICQKRGRKNPDGSHFSHQIHLRLDLKAEEYQGLSRIWSGSGTRFSETNRDKDGANENEDEMGCSLPIRTWNAKSVSNQHYAFVRQLNVVPQSSSSPH